MCLRVPCQKLECVCTTHICWVLWCVWVCVDTCVLVCKNLVRLSVHVCKNLVRLSNSVCLRVVFFEY